MVLFIRHPRLFLIVISALALSYIGCDASSSDPKEKDTVTTQKDSRSGPDVQTGKDIESKADSIAETGSGGCGDGICQEGENPLNCPDDCSAVCGNSECEYGENPDNCPNDCENPCGNGECEQGENPFNCPEDCGAVCGNDECEYGEDPDGCPADCKNPCGNGECDTGENSFNCPEDCGSACGNEECEYGEDPESCPADCAPACGDGTCDSGEQTGCPQDCCANCDDDLECTEGKCPGEGKDCIQVVKEGFCLINNVCYTGGAEKPGNSCLLCEPAVSKEEWQSAAGEPCDDDNPCTVEDSCNDEGACGGAEKVCDDYNLCTLDWCSPETGCVYDNQPGDCDDSELCTFPDKCTDGECNGTPYSCDDDLECTVDECLGDGTCTNTLQAGFCLIANSCFAHQDLNPDSTCLWCNAYEIPSEWSVHADAACNDGNQCTLEDTCDADGNCTGLDKDCDDYNTCTVDWCSPDSGCLHDPQPGDCNDDNSCTHPDKCQEGTCTGTPYSCDDNLDCTLDECLGGGDCTNTLQAGFCLIDGVCYAHQDPNPGNLCLWCNAYEGQSGWSHHNNVACDDGSLCTEGDICTDGSCVPGQSPDCDDSNTCTEDTCNPLEGCVHSNEPGNCDDNNPCTKQDSCIGGMCQGIEYSCDDGLDCTDDECIGDGECQHIQQSKTCLVDNQCFEDGDINTATTCLVCNAMKNNATWSNNDLVDCDDVNVCTDSDICWEGTCAGQSITCPDDSDPCTDDVCTNPFGCGTEFNTASCDDDNKCTENDTCATGTCKGSLITCKDDNFCTDDMCEPETGCVFPVNDVGCDDGNLCTSDDKCTDGACAGTPKDCDDNNECSEDYCEGGFCSSVDISLECNDDNVCTNDWCDPSQGCVNQSNSSPCDDGSYCTVVDVCLDGQCTGGDAPDCDDIIDCTTDYCVPSKGCLHTPNSAACNDQVVCTVDTCDSNGCTNTPLDVNCNDDNSCTTDTCTANGCAYESACGITVFDTTNDIVQASDVLDVMVYDSEPDQGDTAWRAGSDADWALESEEAFKGRSLRLAGFRQDWDGGCEESELQNAQYPEIALPTTGLDFAGLESSIEFWFRIPSRTTKYSNGCQISPFDTGPPVLSLLLYDGSASPEGGDWNNIAWNSRFALNFAVFKSQSDSCEYMDEFNNAPFVDSFSGANGSSMVSIDPDNWVHFALTVDGSNNNQREFILYLDGSKAVQLVPPGPTAENVSKLKLRFTDGMTGNEDTSCPMFDLLVDEFRYYNEVLSPDEVAAHQQADLAGVFPDNPDGLVAHWSFDSPDPNIQTTGDVRLTDRSSLKKFPDIAYLVATSIGVDILDADNGSLWMRFSQSSKGWSVISSSIGQLAAAAGRILMAAPVGGSKVLHMVGMDPSYHGNNYGPWGEDKNLFSNACRFNPNREGLACSPNDCFSSCPGQCHSGEYQTVACRNEYTKIWEDLDVWGLNGNPTGMTIEPFGACQWGEQVFSVVTEDNGGIRVVSDDCHIWPEQYGTLAPPGTWNQLHHPVLADGTLYVIGDRADGSCSNIFIMSDFLPRYRNVDNECMGGSVCNPTDWNCWKTSSSYAGSLVSQDQGAGTNCGSPVSEVNDFVVTAGTSSVNPDYNTLSIAASNYVAVVQESGHDQGDADNATIVRWTEQGGGGAGFKILPAGPYTSIVPCGGYIYVGTNTTGIFVLDVAAPSKVVETYAVPALPTNQIRSLSCTETGPVDALHRVLAATPSGAVEIVAADK
jgi:hypothetical protein